MLVAALLASAGSAALVARRVTAPSTGTLFAAASDAATRSPLSGGEAAPLASDDAPDVIVSPGTGGQPTKLLNGATLAELGAAFPFGPGFGGSVQTAVAELTGDTTRDVLVAMGPGGGLVRLYNGATLAEVGSGYPFGPEFTGGLSLATGDVNGDGRADLIVGQASGGGTVRVFSGRDIALLLSQTPFGAGYAGGVNVASGDIDGDGRAELFVGQASGGVVSIISGATQAVTASGAPYGPLSGGVFVAVGDVNGDGRADIVASPGSGSGAVLVYDVTNQNLLAGFVPYVSAPGGARIAVTDVNADGRGDIVTVPGAGATPELRVYSGATFGLLASQLVYPAGYTGGVFISASSGSAPRFTSAPSATFTAGSAATFTVSTQATPSATSLTLSGMLPAGVTFANNGNGTATLSGTPGAATGGTYALSFSAANGSSASVVQNFMLTVNQAPAVTSAASTTFTVGSSGTFTAVTTGFPVAEVSATGALPAGVTFVSNGNGTGSLAGTPAPGSGGTYALTLTATNGVVTPATQSFVLSVNQAPAVTSATSASFAIGVTRTFTITTSGFPLASVTATGPLPSGITFTNSGNGTGTLAGTPAAGSGGNYLVTIGASNGVGAPASQTLTLVVGVATDAQNETYSNGVGNTQYSVGAGTPSTPAVVVSGSVLSNDTGAAPLSAGPAIIATTNGGHVSMAANGSFLYTPATGFAGPSDTFTYTLTDNGGVIDTAVVTINLSGVVWYVNPLAGGIDGRSHSPFPTMTAAAAAAQAGQTIYVHQGAPVGATALKANQTLWGAGAPFVVNGLAITATSAPTLQGTLTLANGVLVRALAVNGGPSTAIVGANLTGSETLDDVSIVGGSTGLSLTNLGGSLAMSGGAITGVPGTDVFISDGSGSVAVGAAINNTAGRSVEVQNRTGGIVTFSGAVADTGTGVLLNSNTGSTISFTGGLAVATDTVDAFIATGGGTVTATQNNTTIVNTLASTSGQALRVVNTSIGSTGLTFRRIASGNASYGPGVGITLDDTGVGVTNGSLTVVGDNAPGSGGTIRRKSGTDGALSSGLAIYLNSTKSPSFRWMGLSDLQNGAIVGRAVVGFSLQDSVIDGIVGTAADEGALRFGVPNPSGENGLVGGGLLRNVVISGSAGHNAAFYSQSTTMALQIDGATRSACGMGSNSSTTGGDGLYLLTQGTAAATLTIGPCQFRGNRGAGIRLLAEDDSDLTVSITQTDVHRLSGQGDEGIVLRNAGNAELAATITQSSFDALPGANVWMGQEPFNASATSLLRVTLANNEEFSQVAGATAPPWVAALSSTVGQVARSRLLFNNGVTGLVLSAASEALRISTPHAGTSPAADITLLNNHTDTTQSPGAPNSVTISATQAGANLCTNIIGNTFHWDPPSGIGGPLLVTQASGAVFRLERGVASLADSPSMVLTANNNALTLNQVIGALTVVQNGTCLTP